MGKDCGQGNEQLSVRALAANNVAEGETGGSTNSLQLTDFDIVFEKPKI